MKKILLMFAFLIFISKGFSQTTEKFKINCEKNHTGCITEMITEEDIFPNSCITETITEEDIFPNAEKTAFINKIIPVINQSEAYSYDTTRFSVIYYSKENFWLSKSCKSEYKITRLAKVQTLSPHKFAGDILTLAIIIIVMSILFCWRILSDKINLLTLIITALAFAAISIVALFNIKIPGDESSIALFSALFPIIILVSIGENIIKGIWDKGLATVFAILAQSIASVLIGIYTSSLLAFLATIGLAVATWLIFWLIALLFCLIFKGGPKTTFKFIADKFNKR